MYECTNLLMSPALCLSTPVLRQENNFSRVKVRLKSYLFLCSLVGYNVVITTYQTVGSRENAVGMEGNACDDEDHEVWLSGVC